MQSVDVCNNQGNTALHWACINGHEEVVRVLMENSAEPSKLNEFERTPVDEALDRGYQNVVDIIKSFAGGDDNDNEKDIE